MDSCYVWQETSTVDSLSKPQWSIQLLFPLQFNIKISENFDANDFIGRKKSRNKFISYFKSYIFLLNYNTAHCAKW